VYEHTPGVALTQVSALYSNAIGQNVASVSWHEGGGTMVYGANVGSKAEIGVYSFRTGNNTFTKEATFDLTVNVGAVRWSKQGDYFATGDFNHDIRIYQFSLTMALVPLVKTTFDKVGILEEKLDLVLQLLGA
jgi:WD40 repeat protein